MIANGTAPVIFLGDESCCYKGCNDSNYMRPYTDKIRSVVGGGKGKPPFLYVNECAPWWEEYSQPPCCRNHSCAPGLDYRHEPCAGQCTNASQRAKVKTWLGGPCKWATIPPNLDIISMDFYMPSDGGYEADAVRLAYEQCLFPSAQAFSLLRLVLPVSKLTERSRPIRKMQPWQKVMLVPYLAANDPANCALHNASAETDVSCRLDTQAAQTVRRLRGYFEWEERDQDCRFQRMGLHAPMQLAFHRTSLTEAALLHTALQQPDRVAVGAEQHVPQRHPAVGQSVRSVARGRSNGECSNGRLGL